MTGWEFIQSPGPTNIPPEVLAALARPAVDFAAPEFEALVDRCLVDLRALFRLPAGGEVFVYIANGHGAWEGTLVNLFEPGERLLVPDTGVFASAWADTAAALGLDVQRLPVDQRRATPPEAIAAALEADRDHRIAGVAVTHTETATGITCDLAAIGAAMRATGHPAFYVVDAVASLGTAPLETEAWGIDAVVCAGQKGLMLAPGLSFSGASPRALARSYELQRHRAYWAWPARHQGIGYRKFCGTPPVQQIFALRVGLDLLAAEGLDAVLARHQRFASAVRAAVRCWAAGGAVELHAVEESEAAAAVTCVLLDERYDAVALRAALRDSWHVVVGAGLGPMAGRAFRIGHLGAMTEPMLLGVVGAVDAGLRSFGVPIATGALDAAIEQLLA